MAIHGITVTDDGQGSITIDATHADALEPSEAHAITLQCFKYSAPRAMGASKSAETQAKTRTRALTWATDKAARLGGVPVATNWLIRRRAA